jgi:phosphatidate cytidylyltransferase
MHSANDVSAASQSKASSLLWRVLSAAVLLPLTLALVYWGAWPLALFIAAAIVMSLLELYRALHVGGYTPRTTIGIISGLLLCASTLAPPVAWLNWTGMAMAAALLLVLIGELPRPNHADSLASWTLTFAGACYVGWLLSHYLLLRRIDTPLEAGWLSVLSIPSGAAWVYLVLVVTWFADTMAFFVGRTWGRHRMAPVLSPKKSWEGAVGGFVAAVLASMLVVAALGLPLGYIEAALIGAVGGVVGQVGDLVESLLKRQIGLKDIGHLIPGHGGMLDRLDSMLFTAPVLYYLILLLTVPA